MLGASKFSGDRPSVKKSLLGGLLIVESFQCDSSADESEIHPKVALIADGRPSHLGLVEDLNRESPGLDALHELEEFMKAEAGATHSDQPRVDVRKSLPTVNRNNPESGHDNKENKPGAETSSTSASSEDLHARDKKVPPSATSSHADLYARQAQARATIGREKSADHQGRPEVPDNSSAQENLFKERTPAQSLTELLRANPAKTRPHQSIPAPKNAAELKEASSESSENFSFVDELPAQEIPSLKGDSDEDFGAATAEEPASSIRGWAKLGPFALTNIWGRKAKAAASGPKKMVKVPTQEELNFFFRATDDELLYNLGDSFYRDFKNGMRHFGFAHVNSRESQQRSILGIASFIKYFEDNRILIITDKMDGSFFSAFKRESTRKAVEVSALPGFSYNVHQAYSLNYLEMDELALRAKSSRVKVLPTIIKNLMSDYDVVLIDLPRHEARRDHYDLYLPLLQTLNHVTLTVSLKKSLFSEVNELRQYFASYKIKIKGSVVERSPASGRQPGSDRRFSV